METGQNIGIAGFVVQGPGTKRVLVRGIGPSLTAFAIAGALADPILTLKNASGLTMATNDDWRSTQQTDIANSGFAPSDARESAIVATLPAGSYTALLAGVGDTSGVALVEVYDLEPTSTARLINISTRGNVGTGNEVMIGGFVIGGNVPRRVIVRAIGPTLESFGVSGALANPTLRLFTGPTPTAENDDWRSTQQSEILSSGFPPTANQESAVVATLPPGSYTVIVSGLGDTTGVGLVEVFELP